MTKQCIYYHDWFNQKINRYTDLKTQKCVFKQILVGINIRLGNRLNEVFSQIQSVWLAFCCMSLELLHLHAVWEPKVKWEIQNISFYEEGCRHSSTFPVYIAKSSLYAERFPDTLLQDFWVCTLSCNFCCLACWRCHHLHPSQYDTTHLLVEKRTEMMFIEVLPSFCSSLDCRIEDENVKTMFKSFV